MEDSEMTLGVNFTLGTALRSTARSTSPSQMSFHAASISGVMTTSCSKNGTLLRTTAMTRSMATVD
jgi:hypothetical protein